jgi:hypothetical protein
VNIRHHTALYLYPLYTGFYCYNPVLHTFIKTPIGSQVGSAISYAHQIFNFPKSGQKRLPTLQSVDVNFHKLQVKSTFPEDQVLACATDKLRSELLPVTYKELHISKKASVSFLVIENLPFSLLIKSIS